jgi:hypothetical protein
VAETLGKIEKPEAASFKEGRKLIFVPLVFLPPAETDEELTHLVARYWHEAGQQVESLSVRLENLKHVFHELAPGGEDGLRVIDDLHAGSLEIAKKALAEGATLEAIEDPLVLAEFLDWNRCLSVHLDSPKVFNQVYQNYLDADKKRNEALARKLDNALGANELGLAFLREGHHVQFPGDLEVFYVSPPALDAVRRYLSDRKEVPLPKAEKPGAEESGGHQAEESEPKGKTE